MFDFGFSELILIAMVALIVVGPERLPKVARTAGHMLGRLQRYVSDVKSDIQREMQIEDLKKLQQEVEKQARDIETSVRSQMAKVESDLGKTASEVRESLTVDAAPTSASAPDGPAAELTGAAPVEDRSVGPALEAAAFDGDTNGSAPRTEDPARESRHEAQLDLGLEDKPAAPRSDTGKP